MLSAALFGFANARHTWTRPSSEVVMWIVRLALERPYTTVVMAVLILLLGTLAILRTYAVDIQNGVPQTIAGLNMVPVKAMGNTTIFVKDVAWVREGFPPQTDIVRVNGQRASLLTVLKAGNVSTLNIISGIKALLPQIKETVPPSLNIQLLGEESIFVRGAITGVVKEGTIADGADDSAFHR